MKIKESKYSQIIKQTATQLGFDYCGIARAQQLDEDARRLESWLNKGFHGSMDYMNHYFDLRIDPAKLVPGAKSVLHYCLIIFLPRNKTSRLHRFQSMLMEMIIMR